MSTLDEQLKQRGVLSTWVSIWKAKDRERGGPAYVAIKALWAIQRCMVAGHRTRPSLVHAQDAAYCGVVGRIAKHVLDVPFVVHCHNLPTRIAETTPASGARHHSLLLGILRKMEAFALSGADAIIVVAPTLRPLVEPIAKTPEIVHVIPVGVELDGFSRYSHGTDREARQLIGLPSDAFVVGYIGRLSKEKGLPVLLSACSRVAAEDSANRFRLLLVGDGPLRDELEIQAGALGFAAKSRFTGYASDVRPYLAATDVFVLPSFSEGSSLAVLEAVASGTAIVASAEVVSDIVKPNENAVILSRVDSEELYQVLNALYRTPQRLWQLQESSRRMNLSDYNPSKVVDRILRIYKSVLSNDRYES